MFSRYETLKSMSENKMNEFRKMMIVLLVNDDELKIGINVLEGNNELID